MNLSDSEAMAGLLKQAEFKIVDNPEEAALIIINSCNVKGPTQTFFFNYLEKTKEHKKPIVIAGCIPKTIPARVSEFSLIGPGQLDKIVEVVEETLNNTIVAALAEEPIERLKLPKIRKSPIIEIIPISKGCLGSCSYCIVKKARGSLVSYSPEDIIRTARKAVKEGVKEIWLTSQDTGCYGRDIGNSLPEILKKICAIEGNFKVRIGMANPNWIKEHLREMIDIYRHPRIFKFLHIPVQSGSNEILKKMNRKYTKEDFIEIVQKFRQEIPQTTISTDVICGFPGETKEQFSKTVELIKQIEPDVLNISRFSPRPNTQAFYMTDQLDGGEIKERSRIMTREYDWISFKKERKWRNWEGDILIDEHGKDNTFIGRNYAYKPVIIEGNHKIGETVRVKVVNSTNHDLRAVVIV